MTAYTVHLTHVVSTSRTVEADDQNAAVDAAFDAGLPTPGGRVGDAYDDAGEWEPSSVTDDTGVEVWSADAERAALARADREHLAAVTAERDRLLVEVERLRQIEAVARTLREPYQPGGPSAEFIVLRCLLDATVAGR